MSYTELATSVAASPFVRMKPAPEPGRCRGTPSLICSTSATPPPPSPTALANTVTLAVTALDAGHGSDWWATYRQWADLGARVRRGETSARIVRWIPARRTDPDTHHAEADEHGRRLAPKVYSVFNAAQADGWTPTTPAPVTDLERNTQADTWIAGTGARTSYGHNHACYRPAADRIELPASAQFTDPAAFYGTACHELCHWTGHASRLNRDLTGRFGDDAYAAEELVAELGAAIACVHLHLDPHPPGRPRRLWCGCAPT